MNRRLKFAFLFLVLFGIASIGLVFFYSDQIAVLSPKGLIAQKQCNLLLNATLLMLIIVIPTFALTFFISWKYRASNKSAKHSPDWDYNLLAESIWWGVPCILMLVLGVITWKGCHELDPFKPIDSNKAPLRIQVVALQWKWLFIYPDQQIATLNFVQFPEQTPIDFEITADAPMNSFWIPELGGQVYAMAGMKSKLHLIANDANSFRGSSANISGEGFSGMTFIAKSSSKADFDQWVGSVKESSNSLNLDEYTQLIQPSAYVPAATYILKDPDLFDSIVMKYMRPHH
ncbi:MAG: ubiquinol oxidase subunit II [Chlamydiota bacterium]